MVINMAAGASEAELQHVIDRLIESGFQPHVTRGLEGTIVAALGSGSRVELEALKAAPGVEDVVPIAHPFKLVSKSSKSGRTRVNVGGIVIGGEEAVVIAGPRTVESGEQLFSTARAVKAAGATLLHGGVYKPRNSPYDPQSLGIEALQLLRKAREDTGLPVVTEVINAEDIPLISEYADMLQVGARNMQNFSLLRELAKSVKPILLKRGPSATVKEWLLAAEYLLAGGNSNIVLCERGIKTGVSETNRNTLDLAAVALVRELSHLPVIADPSHGTGTRELIGPASRAALAIGADGLIIEVHPCPERALSHGAQSLDLDEFVRLMQSLSAPIRSIGTPANPADRYAEVRAHYQALVQRKYGSGLSPSEEEELVRLGDILDEFDKPYYEKVLARLTALVSKKR
jgi:3-deoxy-7-phosphoheptulonate synthase